MELSLSVPEVISRLRRRLQAQGTPTHVARQLPSGAWTSKLRGAEDIEHETLAGLEGELYGEVVFVMRRR